MDWQTIKFLLQLTELTLDVLRKEDNDWVKKCMEYEMEDSSFVLVPFGDYFQ